MNEKSKSDLDRPVSLKQLADELGFHSSSIRKIVVRRGFTPFRLSEGKNKPLYLKATDAESFKHVTLGVVAFIWVFNVIDATLFFPENGYSVGGPTSISLNTGDEFDRLQMNLAVRF